MKLLKKLNTFITWLPFSLFVLTITAYSYLHFTGEHEDYWKSSSIKNKGRTIASYDDELEFDIYKDFFITNSYNKYLTFEMEPTFWNNHSGDQKKLEANNSLKESFISVFENTNNSIPLIGLFKKNYLLDSIDNLVNQLSESGFKSGDYQVNLNFTPAFYQELNFQKEISSNDLILTNKVLSETYFKTDTSYISEVLNTPIPLTQDRYQYSGGNISININSIDLDKNLYYGKVLYRRYFRANRLNTADLKIENKNLVINYFRLKKLIDNRDNFITVDLVKEIKPNQEFQNSKVVFNFGKILDNGKSAKQKEIDTGSFYINGVYPVNDVNREVNIKVDKLVYSFAKKKFTNESKIFVSFRDKKFIQNRNEKFFIKEIVKNAMAQTIISELDLDQFHKRMESRESIR